MLPEYLLESSSARLSEFCLTRQERATHLRRELLAVLEEYVNAAAEVEAVSLLAAVRRGLVLKKPLQRRLSFGAAGRGARRATA